MSTSPSVIDLQYFQELHDRRYHVDIHSLPLMRRVAHLHQHLVKYSSSTVKRDQTYPDALACLLSMANAFNLNISNGFGLNEYAVNTLDDIGQEWCTDVMLEKYRQALGHMAKLLEASDHTEDYEYRVWDIRRIRRKVRRFAGKELVEIRPAQPLSACEDGYVAQCNPPQEESECDANRRRAKPGPVRHALYE